MDRLRERIDARFAADKDRPRGFRKTQRELADKIGIAESSLSELLRGTAASRGLLAHLDTIAEYFGVPPSLLVHRNDTALMELKPQEYELLRHWRTFPPDVQERIMDLFHYFAGMLPEEKEQRRWWVKLSRLTAAERERFERTLDEQLRGRRPQPSPGTAPAAPGSADQTPAATDRKG